MKKSLFLTTALMVVFLIVALSTATFAWFSASNAVNVSTISFTASSKDGESELHISWSDDPTVDTVEIDFASCADMDPMIPKALPKVLPSGEATTYADFVTDNFFTASESGSTDPVYSGRVAKVDPTPCISKDGQTTFYLINGNQNIAMEAALEYEIEGDLSSALCIAVFVDNKLAGILASESEIYYGDITLGAKLSSQTKTADPVKASGDLKIRIPAGSSVPVKLVAWYSGMQLDNSGKLKQAQLKSIKFDATYI